MRPALTGLTISFTDFSKLRYFTDDNIAAVLDGGDVQEFFDIRFIKELEDRGIVKELYGQL